MSTLSAEQMLQAAVELELAPGPELQEAFREAGGHNADAASLGRVLVRRELLTGYQVEKLLAGSRTGLYYGPAHPLPGRGGILRPGLPGDSPGHRRRPRRQGAAETTQRQPREAGRVSARG